MRRFISALGALILFFGLILGGVSLMLDDLAGLGDIESSVVMMFGSWTIFALVLIVLGTLMVSGLRGLIMACFLAVGIYVINIGVTYFFNMMSYGTEYAGLVSLVIGLIILPPIFRRF